MKKELGFWQSLEEYGWKMVGRSPLPHYWRWIAIGVILIVLGVSLKYGKYSLTGAENVAQAIEISAQRGDYETARQLLGQGVEGELEEMVYPEKVVERRIAELEGKLVEYPGSREIFVSLADLYDQLGETGKANEYRENARILDPNGVNF